MGPVCKAIDAQVVAVAVFRVPVLQCRAGRSGAALASASRQPLQGLPLCRSDYTLSAVRNSPINDGAWMGTSRLQATSLSCCPPEGSPACL